MAYLRFCTLFVLFAFYSATVFAETISVIPEVNLRAIQGIKKSDRLQMTTHIDQKEIAHLPVINLAQLFKQNQSIVRLTNNSGDSSQTALSIRGFGDNAAANSLILIDGFPLTNASLFAPNFNYLALTDIERVDIIQGSKGTLWGNQAVGGVVNIITRHPEKWLSAINAGGGSFNRIFFNGVLGNKMHDNGLFFKGSAVLSDADNYRAHQQQTNKSVVIQLGKDDARGTVSFQFQKELLFVNFPGGLNALQFKNTPQLATNFVNDARVNTNELQLLSKYIFSENWLLETRLTHRTLSGDGFVFIPYTRSETIDRIAPRLMGKIVHSKIIAGVEGVFNQYALNNAKVQQKAHANETDFFAEIVTPFQQGLDVTLGARFAQQNNAVNNGAITTPSRNQVWVTEQGLAYAFAKNINVYLRRDGNFRMPKANENSWCQEGNVALNAQTGVSYETGLTWMNDQIKTQLSLYHLQLNNEIAFDPTQSAGNPFGAFQNYLSTLRRGATLVFDYHLSPKINVATQLNYVQAQFLGGAFAGKEIPAVPAWNGNVGVDFLLTDTWQVRYVGLYTGARFASNDVANVNAKDPSYWLHSLALEYIFKTFYASFEVNNLFNQIYSTYTLFNGTTHTSTYYPGMGRNYLLSFKINLD